MLQSHFFANLFSVLPGPLFAVWITDIRCREIPDKALESDFVAFSCPLFDRARSLQPFLLMGTLIN